MSALSSQAGERPATLPPVVSESDGGAFSKLTQAYVAREIAAAKQSVAHKIGDTQRTKAAYLRTRAALHAILAIEQGKQ
jgi:hypothetical protein